ncbi:MAG: glycosyl hydrolase [Candidatus Cloacimonas sp.]|jgi:hypothetical protein|nr:glycosyl hydrolase [Candidatus Cloacimonas sp.]
MENVKGWLLAFLCVLVLLTSQMVAENNSRFGVVSHNAYGAHDKVVEAGIGWVRAEVHWDRIESKDDLGNISRDWSTLDNMIADAKVKGLSVIFGIDGIPLYYCNGIVNEHNRGAYLPANRIPEWENFFTDVITRYKGTVKYWCVWNEPNLKQFWNTPGTQSLLERAELFFSNIFDPAAAIFDANNDGSLYFCGPDTSSYSDNYSAKYFINMLFNRRSNIDVIFHHQYDSEDIDEFISNIIGIKSYIASIGKGSIPFWITETAVGEGSEIPKCLYDVMTYVKSQSYIQKVFWYALIDDTPTPNSALVARTSYAKFLPWYAYRYGIAGKPETLMTVKPASNATIYNDSPRLEWTRDVMGHFPNSPLYSTVSYQIQISENNIQVYSTIISEFLWNGSNLIFDMPSGVLQDNKVYRWRVRSINSKNEYSDYSPYSTFSVRSPFVTVTSPNGGESWQRGTTKTITWVNGGIGNIKIELLQNGNVVTSNLPTSISPSSQSHSWTIPTNLSGNNFKIKISTISNSLSDTSNNNFSIITAPASPPNPPSTSGQLLAGEGIGINVKLYSPNRAFALKMQSDGNAVLYKMAGPKALWSTGTAGQPVKWIKMQNNGDLDLLRQDFSTFRTITTGGTGAKVKIQNDGNMVLYRSNGTAAWSTHTAGS